MEFIELFKSDIITLETDARNKVGMLMYIGALLACVFVC